MASAGKAPVSYVVWSSTVPVKSAVCSHEATECVAAASHVQRALEKLSSKRMLSDDVGAPDGDQLAPSEALPFAVATQVFFPGGAARLTSVSVAELEAGSS